MWCKTPHLPPVAWHVSPGFLSHMHKLLTRWSCKAYLMLTFDWIVLPHQSQCLKKCKILTERRCKCTKVFGELMKWIFVWLQTAIYCRQKVETLQTVGQMVGYFNSNKADSFICDVKAYFWWILTSGCTGLMLSKIPQFSMCYLLCTEGHKHGWHVLSRWQLSWFEGWFPWEPEIQRKKVGFNEL